MTLKIRFDPNCQSKEVKVGYYLTFNICKSNSTIYIHIRAYFNMVNKQLNITLEIYMSMKPECTDM